jgi:hypothetical protein
VRDNYTEKKDLATHLRQTRFERHPIKQHIDQALESLGTKDKPGAVGFVLHAPYPKDNGSNELFDDGEQRITVTGGQGGRRSA